MKRTLSSISAAAIVLGTGIPMVFADTTSTTPSYTQVGTVAFQFNGQTVANPYILDSQDSGNTTAFAPVYYFNQLLAKAGIQATWNGSTHTWALTAPNIDASKVQVAGGVGTGNTTITLNGTTIKMINTFAAQDPAGKKGDITTYFPAYYVNNLFAALGISATWNGSTGLAVNTQATALTAKQTAAAQVAVNFNGPVASGTTVTLSQNGVNYTTTATWSGNTEVTLNTGYNLPAGTYTVTAGSLSGTVTIAEAVPTSIEITTKGLSVTGTSVSYEVLDQFGNQVSNPGTIEVSAFDQKLGQAATVTAAGTTSASITLPGSATAGDTVVVAVTDPTYSLTATTTLQVYSGSIETLKLGAVTDNGSSSLGVGDSITIAYTATDAAGDSVTLPAGTYSLNVAASGVVFYASNPAVVANSALTVSSSGVLTFTGEAGSGTITVVDLATGQTSSVSVNVASTTAVNTFTMAQPTSMVLANAAATIPYTATNAFGQAIAQSSFTVAEQSQLTFATSNPNVPSSDVTWNEANNALQFTAPATFSGAVTIYAYNKTTGALESSVTLNVEPASVPYAVTGTTIPTEFEQGGTFSASVSNFTIKDQYGNTYTAPSGDVWEVISSSGAVVQVGSASGSTWASATVGDGNTIPLSGTAASGTATLTFLLYPSGTVISANGAATNASGNAVSALVSYSVNASDIASTSVATYSLTVPSTIYAGVVNSSGNVVNFGSGTVALVGKDSSGNTVAVSQADIAYLTSSNPSAVTVSGTTTIEGNGNSGTAVITAFNSSGTQLASATVTASSVAPTLSSLAIDENKAAVTSVTLTAASSTATLTAVGTDQYGNSVSSVSGTWFSSNSSVVSVTQATGSPTATVSAGATDGSATLTFVSSNGVVTTIQVVNDAH
ncbi:hypothetical protein URH17368_0566 [Alicyclobacillus hesperidum URH17-3-68]|uniref:beta strand repeat-containing protein n=1 Tax=Alicyclobacillus hesperidum TaxID=89784 RepID=UPI000281BB3D|nr:hypothetical protein [Alicyclobacillus hesperidum]EJY56601.1 hypothetical protein URH17368_0566 [Alicyclobacillus hesperidum URH17-3-68]